MKLLLFGALTFSLSYGRPTERCGCARGVTDPTNCEVPACETKAENYCLEGGNFGCTDRGQCPLPGELRDGYCSGDGALGTFKVCVETSDAVLNFLASPEVDNDLSSVVAPGMGWCLDINNARGIICCNDGFKLESHFDFDASDLTDTDVLRLQAYADGNLSKADLCCTEKNPVTGCTPSVCASTTSPTSFPIGEIPPSPTPPISDEPTLTPTCSDCTLGPTWDNQTEQERWYNTQDSNDDAVAQDSNDDAVAPTESPTPNPTMRCMCPSSHPYPSRYQEVNGRPNRNGRSCCTTPYSEEHGECPSYDTVECPCGVCEEYQATPDPTVFPCTCPEEHPYPSGSSWSCCAQPYADFVCSTNPDEDEIRCPCGDCEEYLGDGLAGPAGFNLEEDDDPNTEKPKESSASKNQYYFASWVFWSGACLLMM